MKKSKKTSENTDNKVEKNDCNPLNIEPSTKDIEPEKSEKETHENENLLNEIKDLKDQLLRSLAENENLRKRTSKDIEQIKKFGHISFVRELLSSVDNLDRAVKASNYDKEKIEEGTLNLIKGIEIVVNEINNLLEKNHINKIEPLHEKFDYNLHQAMYEAPSDKFDDGIITEVIQPGYTLHDRLVRPAMVGVSKGKELKSNENIENAE